MARLEGSKNNNISAQPVTISLSVEERLEFLANIIVDRIMDDQSDGQKLQKSLETTLVDQLRPRNGVLAIRASVLSKALMEIFQRLNTSKACVLLSSRTLD